MVLILHVSYTGELTTDSPRWIRPFACDCPRNPLSESFRNVRYTVQSLNVLTTGLFNVIITVDSAQDSFDGFIVVYQQDFDPMFPDENVLGCDDDDSSDRDSF